MLNTKKQQATLAKGTVGAMVTSAASLGLNILQDMSEPVFEMKFESLPPASKVGYRQVLLELMIDHRSYTHNLSSCENNSGLNGIHDFCDTGAVLYLLSY